MDKLLAVIAILTDLGRPLGTTELEELVWLLESEPNRQSPEHNKVCLGYGFRMYSSNELYDHLCMLRNAGYSTMEGAITDAGRTYLTHWDAPIEGCTLEEFRALMKPKIAVYLAEGYLMDQINERVNAGHYPSATPPSCVRF